MYIGRTIQCLCPHSASVCMNVCNIYRICALTLKPYNIPVYVAATFIDLSKLAFYEDLLSTIIYCIASTVCNIYRYV